MAEVGGGSDGLAAKTTYCSCIGPEFGSQHSCLVPHNCLMFQGGPLPLASRNAGTPLHVPTRRHA